MRHTPSEPVPRQEPLLPERPVTPPLAESIAQLIAVLALVAVSLSVSSILSPFVVVGGVLFLLYPLRLRFLPRRVMTLSLILLGLWFVHTVFGLLVPFLAAFVLAYLFDPLVTRLAARRFPRWISSLVVVLCLVGTVVSVFLFLLPVLLMQFEGILTGVRILLQETTAWLNSDDVLSTFQRFGIPPESVREMLASQFAPRLEDVFRSLIEGVLGLVTGISSVALHVINAVIIPFLLFYLLKDFPGIGNRFYRLFSDATRSQARAVMGRIDGIMGGYVRGAVFVAIIQGAISASVLALVGVRYALLLGLMTGVLNFIPYIGLVTSLVVASIVALFSGEPVLTKVLAVVILYLSQKLLEATVLGPKIIGPQVGLHPVLLILCLLLFGYFLGFVGLLIAVPATALLLSALEAWESHRGRTA
jgi:predicted PurR-regulated permease PerM